MSQRVSIAMCTFNGERFLREQLESLAVQTHPPLELVICDDQSADGTARIVEQFAAAARFPVRWTRNPQRLGVTANFAQAIRLCTGDLIALSDQDDIWLPHKLERLVSVLEQHPAVVCVFSNASLMNNASEDLGQDSWERFLFTPALQQEMLSGRSIDVLLKAPVVSGAAMVFRAPLRERMTPIPAGWVHDAWLAWIAALTGTVLPVSEKLNRYRLHETQRLGLPVESGRQRLKRVGVRRWLAQQKADAVRQYEHMALTYRGLSEFVEARSLGSEDTRGAIREKAAFAEQALRCMQMPRVVRALPALMHLRQYRRFTPRGTQAILRQSVL